MFRQSGLQQEADASSVWLFQLNCLCISVSSHEFRECLIEMHGTRRLKRWARVRIEININIPSYVPLLLHWFTKSISLLCTSCFFFYNFTILLLTDLLHFPWNEERIHIDPVWWIYSQSQIRKQFQKWKPTVNGLSMNEVDRTLTKAEGFKKTRLSPSSTEHLTKNPISTCLSIKARLIYNRFNLMPSVSC